MAKKSFSLRIFRVISNIHLCHSDDSTAVLRNPAPRRHVSTALKTACCVPRPLPRRSSGERPGRSTENMVGENDAPSPPTVSRKKRRSRKRKTEKARVSTSSADSGRLFNSDGFSGTDDLEETETLFSSFRSFSTGCSSEYWNNNPLYAPTTSANRRNDNKPKARPLSPVSPSVAGSEASPVRLSVFFKRLMPCPVEGKVRESFAVVKRSDSPYEDFKGSMMNMIVQKQIFQEQDLEQLLHCFLSLNSSDHHALIVHAFTEIWESMFRNY